MKNKHPHAAVVLVLGLAMAGLHLADLLLWSEADTGFAAAGSVWLRYIPWLAAFALPYLSARRAAAQPAGLQDTNKPLGVCMALAGAALLASGVAAGNTARYAILYPEVLSGSCPVWAAWADLLLPIFASESDGMRYCRLMVSCRITLSLRCGSNEIPVTVPIFTPCIMTDDADCTPLTWS